MYAQPRTGCSDRWCHCSQRNILANSKTASLYKHVCSHFTTLLVYGAYNNTLSLWYWKSQYVAPEATIPVIPNQATNERTNQPTNQPTNHITTPWNTVLLNKRTVVQPVKKFNAFMANKYAGWVVPTFRTIIVPWLWRSKSRLGPLDSWWWQQVPSKRRKPLTQWHGVTCRAQTWTFLTIFRTFIRIRCTCLQRGNQ